MVLLVNQGSDVRQNQLKDRISHAVRYCPIIEFVTEYPPILKAFLVKTT